LQTHDRYTNIRIIIRLRSQYKPVHVVIWPDWTTNVKLVHARPRLFSAQQTNWPASSTSDELIRRICFRNSYLKEWLSFYYSVLIIIIIIIIKRQFIRRS